ncbi:putative PepSY-like beta-lactamase-inhibitor [Chitinophaga skermanii]|uniref:Putative PepSY-like beta-lactamase-inhibitor n=1 Tax=Chitinophaga skermanii TaxID=331697 RepID=A0A327QQF3_9BACT|nr:PepSY-like domain-containing protein [Chitinophaga skermanii]RAJ06481.1 putative PepSY-like beta-lactamase-inhibitor [Chitinophaga skermanii]
MKKLIFSWIICCLAFSVYAQDIPASQVPVGVTKTFKTKFPTAGKVEWEMKGDLYEAEFKVNRVEHKAHFSKDGNLVIYKKDIRQIDLPQGVQNTLRNKYKDYKIDDVEKVVKGKNVYYQVELDGKPDLKLVFTGNGKEDTTQAYW